MGVEPAGRPDPRPIGEPGQADAVVGLLGDGPCDVGAVAVAVVWMRGAVDEVIAPDELVGREVGRADEAAVVAVGDAGVEHGDDHALSARTTDGVEVGPSGRGVDAERTREVPLQLRPAAGDAGAARVIRDQRGRGGRRLRDLGDIVGDRPEHAGPPAQARDGGGDWFLVAEPDEPVDPVVAGTRSAGRRRRSPRPGRPGSLAAKPTTTACGSSSRGAARPAATAATRAPRR